MAAFGLYAYIRANKIRSALLIAGLFLLVYALVYAGALMGEALQENAPLSVLAQRAVISMIPAAPFATLVVLAWIGIAYLANQRMVSALTGAYDVTQVEEPELYNLLENLCISRGMTVPKLSIIETNALNAYASGLSEKQYAITVTRGLMEALTHDEIEAVLAHELTHIRNKDVQMMVTAIIIAGVISFFSEIIFRWLRFLPHSSVGREARSNGKSNGGASIAFLIAFALAGVAWTLSVVIRFALSRSREYLADAGAVELTKNPDAMISALLKISGNSDLRSAPSSIMEMCVVNQRHGIAGLLATHPPIEKRIEALVQHAGGYMPKQEGIPGPWGSRIRSKGPWG